MYNGFVLCLSAEPIPMSLSLLGEESPVNVFLLSFPFEGGLPSDLLLLRSLLLREGLLVKDSLLLLAMSSLLTRADLLVGVRLMLLLFGGGLLVDCLSLVLLCDLLSQLRDEL